MLAHVARAAQSLTRRLPGGCSFRYPLADFSVEAVKAVRLMQQVSLNHRDRERGWWIGIAAAAATLMAASHVHGQCPAGELMPADAAANDQFGYSVAYSGNLCVVGARLDDGPFANNGSATVFRYQVTTNEWIQEARVVASDAAAFDEFGFSVAAFSNGDAPTSTEWIVVGSRHDDDNGTDSGSAYIFRKNSGVWTQFAKIKASDAAGGDRFGTSAAMHGDSIIIGARDDDSPPSTNAGAAYVYRYNGTAWTQQTKLRASDFQANDQFGTSVALARKSDGTSLVALVGSWHDDDMGADSGSAYVFAFNPATSQWMQQAKLTAGDGAASDLFGFSVAIAAGSSGEVALIGAKWDDDNGTNSGSAYLFRRGKSGWAAETKLTAGGAGDEFGGSVALSADGMAAVVGAPLDDDAGVDAGMSYHYRFIGRGAAWSAGNSLVSENPTTGDNLGSAVAISGDRAVATRHLRDFAGTDSGTVDVFAGVSMRDDNANGTPDGCDVFGDADGNGNTYLEDLLMVLAGWGLCPAEPTPCPADLSGDRLVDVRDLLIVISGWTM